MEKKAALFAFNGDAMCFIHVLLNAMDMHHRGYEVLTVIEGSATALLPQLAKPENPLHQLWEKSKSEGLIHGVCRACSTKMGTLKEAEAQGLTILDDMSGHPGMGSLRDRGYEIITF